MKKILIAGISKTKLDRFNTWRHDQYQVLRARNAEEFKRFFPDQDLIVIDDLGPEGKVLMEMLVQAGFKVLLTSSTIEHDEAIPHLAWPFKEQEFLDKVCSLLENHT